MQYLTWSLPALAVIALIASGRVNAFRAGLAGTVLAAAVALLAAPRPFALAELETALLRGAWIGWVVIPYIFGGLLFWQVAARERSGEAAPPPEAPILRRRRLFTACFIMGPFAESATGFGVGIIGAMALIRPLGVAPLHLLAFSLLSQTMILWGAMGSGAIVGAAFAGTDVTALVLHCSLFLAAFLVFWLPLFWRMAWRAGLGAGPLEHLAEAIWMAGALGLAVGATLLLGPEPAMLAAYGPLIVLRFLLEERPGRARLAAAAWRALPFALTIGGLVLSRLVLPLRTSLEETWRLAPFAQAPAWSPLLHAGTWLMVAALLTSLLGGQARHLPDETRGAWRTGRIAILSIVAFSLMAEILSVSGIAAGLAQGLFLALGPWAALTTPLLSGVFGGLANSGNASNGLFMAAQASLAATAGLNVAAMIALQHMSGLSMSMFSPVRMAIVCGLAGTPGRERDAYRVMLPFAAAAFMVLMAAALLIAARLI
ncbi:L-lactate permease [Acetobacteraceae bacterium H6797]|nr:L-lactate permease [Acetobacteraceae bacterium H6797]